MIGELRIRGGISDDDDAGGDGEGDDGFEDGLLIATPVGVEVISWTSREHSITAGDSSSPSICGAGRRVVSVVVVGSAMFRCCVVAFLLLLCSAVVGMVMALLCSTIGSPPVWRPAVTGDKLLALVVRSFLLLLEDAFVE